MRGGDYWHDRQLSGLICRGAIVEEGELGVLLAAAEVFRLTLEAPYAVALGEVRLTAVVGAAVGGGSGSDLLLEPAGSALAAAKARGGGCVEGCE